MVFSFSISAQIIFWKEGEKLTWDDFKKEKSERNSMAVAYAFCGLTYEVTKSSNPKDPVRIEVKSVFNQEKSWKSKENATDYILKHEQNHFDIAEIFARKIRKMVQEKIRTSGEYDRYFKKYYSDLYKEYLAFQEKYDYETHHGINKDIQEKYNQLIENQLTELNHYQ